jgi:hypothetical protein
VPDSCCREEDYPEMTRHEEPHYPQNIDEGDGVETLARQRLHLDV